MAARTVTNSYDNLTNLITETDDSLKSPYNFGYDGRGNVTSTKDLTFTYDISDQPIAMNGTAPNTGTSVNGSYEYDGNLKRVKSIVNGIIRYNVYDHKGRLVHVEEGNETYVSETNYLHGAGMTLARIKNGVFTYMHPDHLGSPQAGTDATGAVEWNEYYTPFGESLINNAANDNQSGFTGHIKDADTGLNYMQARYYDPNIGRFLSVDPVTFMDTGSPSYFNRYAYVANDPVNMVDPFGMYQCGSADNVQECSDDINNAVGSIRDAANDSTNAQAAEILGGIADYYGEAGEENGVFINQADLGSKVGAQFQSDGQGGGQVTLNSQTTDFSTQNGRLNAAGDLVHEGSHGVSSTLGIDSSNVVSATMNESRAFQSEALFAQHHARQGNNYKPILVTNSGRIRANSMIIGVQTSVSLTKPEFATYQQAHPIRAKFKW